MTRVTSLAALVLKAAHDLHASTTRLASPAPLCLLAGEAEAPFDLAAVFLAMLFLGAMAI